MELKINSQYAGEDPLFKEIQCLLRQRKYKLFRMLVAFTSISGLKLIEDDLLAFLARKNYLDWIIGVEGSITSKEVLEYSIYLKEKFPDYVNIRIFTAGNNTDIFHPKLYVIADDSEYNIIIGSNNFTLGGLLRNFESSSIIKLNVQDSSDTKVIYDYEILWKKYSTPCPPLTDENLIEVTPEILDRFTNDSSSKRREIMNSLYKVEHPFKDVNKHLEIKRKISALYPLPPKKTKTRNETKGKGTIASKKLVMDILQETRETQVQIPTAVLKPYFGVTNIDADNEIILYELIDGMAVNPKVRPIISQPNKTHRIELSGIKGMLRPLIVIFTKIDADIFEYEVIPKSSHDYETLSKQLNDSGEQSRKGARRWFLISN